MKTILILTKKEVKEMIDNEIKILKKDFESQLNRLLLKVNDIDQIIHREANR